MKLIKQEKINTQMSDQQVWNFNVLENGVYIISISARCKNWFQNYKRLFNDDDLAIQVDDYLFAEIKGKKREFASPGSWNGNEIKNNTKNVLFILPIKVGTHQIKFWVDGLPTLEEIKIYKVDESKIDLVDNIIESAKYLDVIFKNLKIEKLEIKAKAETNSNLEIKIDGNIEKNPKYKRFTKWYWYGRELKGGSKEYVMQDSWDGEIHSLQLYSQGKPEMESIKLKINLENVVYSSGVVRLYKDIVPNDSVNLRMQPTDESDSLMMLQDGEKLDIIKEKVVGKDITNLSNIWHEVIARGVKGYVLSSFVEIEGQERDKIIFKIKEQAKIQGIDIDFVLALAGCESHYKPYAVSDSGARGIFQLTGVAIKHLHEKLNFDINDDEVFEPSKNIIAGLIYLFWLVNIYKGKKDDYKKIVAAWNAGQSLIPINGSITFEHIENLKKRDEVKRLVNCVEQNRKSKNWLNVVTIIMIITIFVLGTQLPHLPKVISIEAQVLNTQDSSSTVLEFKYPDLGIKDILVTDSFNKSSDNWITNVEFVIAGGTYFEQYPGALYNAYFDDHIGFGFPKLVIVRGEGQSILTSILEFNSHDKNLTKIDFIDKNGVRSDTLCCKYMLLMPMNNATQYDIGMPNFSTNPIEVKVYRYNTEEHAFIEERFEYLK